jgi:hypothetical protein
MAEFLELHEEFVIDFLRGRLQYLLSAFRDPEITATRYLNELRFA